MSTKNFPSKQDASSKDGPEEKSRGASVTNHVPTKSEETTAKRHNAQRKADNLHSPTALPNSSSERRSITRSESTDIERRVLAHERILQAFIAHMVETEPKFLRRLTDTFCIPMEMVRCEHDYTDTNSYAEQFVRAVVNLGDKPAKKSSESIGTRHLEDGALSRQPASEMPLTMSPRFQITHVGGVWRVVKDGHFHSDFSKEEDALAFVEVAGSATV